ncbi:30S ribosomal protein S12 methylthiotransferase RimO [Candidatus Viridilinea mediisalina]|uniref:Ribosomal protein uS12 methylthiotransferase RimO n=1 Tax=Candidatus Viridilinea mediisalina TaxID=2024553 RepID=A0A2A6RIW8_9CHLR|nr:30S ribosomal protein S12 methylthiotransferase RimO [Candidatus Viridilinea mediisalina]PDW03017.1 30S ribosomal protein S12 methylthiotransferase RimO [Candidatus Viridilinea mediisalina]
MKYHILTLGCPKNAVDSEAMDGLLAAAGHSPVAELAAADLIIVNTCSFIATARDETLQTLQQLAAAKRPDQRLIAAGCMAQSHQELVAALPGVDQTLSTREWMRVVELVAPEPARPTAQTMIALEPAPSTPSHGYADWRTAPMRRTRSTPSAYLKISDGCNLHCAFCTIPSFKGTMASKPLDAILTEAQQLVTHGVRELVLVAQHLTDYGRDLGMSDGLATLLAALCQVLPAQTWVRLMYAYPHAISEQLIDVMSSHQQIVKYLDLPLQHAHPETLRRMRRPPDTEQTKRTIAALRATMPDIALRSTFIVGFPGETTAEFQTLLAFLEEVQLDRVGAFRYSQEPGTHAASLPHQVRPHVIERRWHALMQLQREISVQRNARWLDRELPVLIEGQGQTDDDRPLSLGRSFRDAPEVDGHVFVWGSYAPGSLVPVRITQTSAYDLWGIPTIL